MDESPAYRRTLVSIVFPDAAIRADGEPTLADAAASVESWWCDKDLGGRAFTPYPKRPLACRFDVETLIHQAGIRAMTPNDVLTIYVTGHGNRAHSGAHHLRLGPGAGVYPTVQIVMAAFESAARHVLVIVDSCHAGALHAEFARLRVDLRADRQRLTTLAVLATADHDELPRTGEFAHLLNRVDQRLHTAGYSDAHLSLEEFLAELLAAARQDPLMPLLETWKIWPPRSATEPTPCLPNPAYEEPDTVVAASRQQVADTAAVLDYWLDRASGRPTTTDPGWYFTGREQLITTVADFLTNGHGLLLVTGAAGTGKSALIARAVTLADPGFRADPRYAAALAASPRRTLPPPNAIHAAVLARNKPTDRIAAELLTALGTPPTAGLTLPALRDRLRAVLLDRGNTTIVIDGLDEADSPTRVLIEIIGPLARLADPYGRHPARLIIGVRSAQQPTSSGDATSDSGHELLELARRTAQPREVTICRTDGPDTHHDIADYVDALLSAPPSPYANDARLREQIAGVIATTVAPSFLDARIAGTRLRDDPHPRRPDDTEWLDTLEEGTVGQLAADLADTVTPQHPASILLAVLRATAFAQGAGIPWAEVWPAVAAAILDDHLPNPNETISYLLHSRLAGYLVRDSEDGRHVWRPAHERLAEVLRTQPRRLLAAAATSHHAQQERS
jgi:AAA ATPase domain